MFWSLHFKEPESVLKYFFHCFRSKCERTKVAENFRHGGVQNYVIFPKQCQLIVDISWHFLFRQTKIRQGGPLIYWLNWQPKTNLRFGRAEIPRNHGLKRNTRFFWCAKMSTEQKILRKLCKDNNIWWKMDS